MLKSKMRLLGASALVGAGLLATGPADAYTMRLGEMNVQIDTTMSVGMTYQMKDSNKKFLPESNGGPAENNPNFDFVRDDNGDIKYYDFSLLDADGNAKAMSQTLSVREEALMTDGVDGVTLGTFGTPDGGKPVLDYIGGTGVNNCTDAWGGHCQQAPAAMAYNYDGSINTDDGRLNFDMGDAVSAPVKLTTDIELRQGAFTGFFRVKAFYDAILMDESSSKRGLDFTDDGEELAGASIDMLDAYVSYDFDVADMPATIRAGKQVINWGEATFIPGGNSAFNPIDVPAIRRPGAEIKEALLPVEALYGSIAISDTISAEAYVGGWDRYLLDVGGTFFAASDSIEPGSNTGNPSDHFFVGGGPKSGTQWVCDTEAHATALVRSGPLRAAIDTARGSSPCDGSANADALLSYTVGSAEQERFAINELDGIGRLADNEGDSSMGLAVRWYAENLNSTEFGFYYQKMDSRLPYVSYVQNPTTLTGSVVGANASQVTRGAGLTGCAANLNGSAAAWYAASYDEDADTDPADVKFDFATAHYRPESGDIGINDPHGLTEAYGDAVATNFSIRNSTGVGDVLQQTAQALGGLVAGGVIVGEIEKARKEADADAKPYTVGVRERYQWDNMTAAERTERFGEGVLVYEDSDAVIAAHADDTEGWADRKTALKTAMALQSPADYEDAAMGTIAAVQQANCAGNFSQAMGTTGAGFTLTGGHPFDTQGQLPTGAIGLGYQQTIDLRFDFPEVETYGMSFNTVLGGWGIQGDFSYRPDAPLQIDTDVLTIAALFQACAAIGAGGAESAYMRLENYNNEFLGSETGGCTNSTQTFDGWVEHDVMTWDIGTTATFTRSNPIIAALGADIGILLTEFQGLVVDGAEDRATPGTTLNKVPLQNVCTSGSDLALNTVLNIDQRNARECRATDESSGMVLLARATWNNVLGTPISLSPTVVYRTGLSGFSPSPVGSWKEDVGSTALSVGFDYLGSVTGSINYVTYQGDDLYTKNSDREHMSVSLSYAF